MPEPGQILQIQEAGKMVPVDPLPSLQERLARMEQLIGDQSKLLEEQLKSNTRPEYMTQLEWVDKVRADKAWMSQDHAPGEGVLALIKDALPAKMRLVDEDLVLDFTDLECLKTELRHSRKAIANFHNVIDGYRQECREAHQETLEVKEGERRSRILIAADLAGKMQAAFSRLGVTLDTFRDCANRVHSSKLRPKTDKQKLAHKDEQIGFLVGGIIETQRVVERYLRLWKEALNDSEIVRADTEKNLKAEAKHGPTPVSTALHFGPEGEILP
jgi:hypothetical protein